MKYIATAAAAAAIALTSSTAMAACDDGEIVIKLSHVTNTDKHPKDIAASLLEELARAECSGFCCLLPDWLTDSC